MSELTQWYDSIATDMNLPLTSEYVKCSFCEKLTGPQDLVTDRSYPEEGFCSIKCFNNWDDLNVSMNRDWDWDSERKLQEGF